MRFVSSFCFHAVIITASAHSKRNDVLADSMKKDKRYRLYKKLFDYVI